MCDYFYDKSVLPGVYICYKYVKCSIQIKKGRIKYLTLTSLLTK